MIEIRNTSQEPWELIVAVAGDVATTRLDPGHAAEISHYVPGMALSLRPVHDHGRPRGERTGTREG